MDDLAARSSERLDWRDSIVDLLKLLGMDSSLDERKRLATELSFTGDFGDDAMMNIFLHNRIIMKIVENHAVDVVATLDGLVARSFERLDWRDSIVDLMKLLEMDSDLEERKRLATEFGFTGDLSGSGTMNMWLHARLMIMIVDNGGSRHEYRGHRIELRAREGEFELRIDDQPVRYDKLPNGKYFLYQYAYDWRDNLMDLARRFIDYRDQTNR